MIINFKNGTKYYLKLLLEFKLLYSKKWNNNY